MQPAPAQAAPAREVAALCRPRPALLQSWTLHWRVSAKIQNELEVSIKFFIILTQPESFRMV